MHKRTNTTDPHQLKTEGFDFDKISLFFKACKLPDIHQTLTDSTCEDLDFDELFMYADRTYSRVGQQYLYHTLRTIPTNKKRTDRFEQYMHFFQQNPAARPSVIQALVRLNKPGTYYLQSLFFGRHLRKPSWFWTVPVLSSLSVITLILSYTFPALLLFLLLLLSINYLLHYWNKNNLLQYTNAIPQLLMLNEAAKKVLHTGILQKNDKVLRNAVEAIDRINRKAFIFEGERLMNSEPLGPLLYMLAEIIKALFLLEPLFLFSILHALKDQKHHIYHAFSVVGEIDIALSIDALRKSLPYYAIPEFTSQKKGLYGKDMYHLLLSKPVANTLQVADEKSVLISGSNMSGKTTFIRTVGINAVLAQTINTALAREFVLPKLKIHAAIRITDDLLNARSYYLEEVLSVGELLRESESNEQQLFLLDELFKGTNTLERISIAKAVLSYLNQQNHLVFAATHDLELTTYLAKTFSFYHFTETIESQSLSFDYLLKEGVLTNTNAIRILEMHQYPLTLIDEARSMADILRSLSN